MNYLRTVFSITPFAEWACECLAAIAEENGYEGFEYSDTGLIGYVTEERYSEDTVRKLIESFPNSDICITYTTTPLSDINWNATWEETGFQPIIIDGKCIVVDERHPIAPSLSATYPICITIRATQSFGTGTHATTQLMLRQLMSTGLSGKMVIDCGCGTGILAIAAARKGAQPVIAFDIDHWSTECAQYNALANQAQVEVRLGDISAVAGMQACADMVLANINRNVLLADMAHYARLCKPHGTVLLSGILTDDAPVVCRHAEESGLELVQQLELEGWLLLQLTKPAHTHNNVS